MQYFQILGIMLQIHKQKMNVELVAESAYAMNTASTFFEERFQQALAK